MIQLREYSPADYPAAHAWWQGHGWAPVAAEILPRLGMVAEIDGRAAGMGWCYLDNSVGVAIMEWLVTDPANTPRQSAQAVFHLAQCLTGAAKALGYGVTFTSCRQQGLARLLERAGFQKTDTDVIHLMHLN